MCAGARPAILPRMKNQSQQTALRLILGVVLIFPWTASFAQDTTEVPNPPAIPTEQERVSAEQAAGEYLEKQRAQSPGGSALDGAYEREYVEGDTTVTEYGRGNRVYSLKIKPGQGPTQYLDSPGDGQLESSPANEGLSDDVNLPKWRLGHW